MNLGYGAGRVGKEITVKVKMINFCNSPSLTRQEIELEWGNVKNGRDIEEKELTEYHN